MRLCSVDEVPEGDARGFDTPDGEIVIARRDGNFYAYRNVCPHLGIGLNFQPDVFMDLDGQYLSCANHGALFQVEDGHCVWGPCAGQRLDPATIRVEGSDILWERQASGLQS